MKNTSEKEVRLRVFDIAGKLRNLRNATRLWNWIDHQWDSDYLFHVMLKRAPWAFHDSTDPNSIIFTYSNNIER